MFHFRPVIVDLIAVLVSTLLFLPSLAMGSSAIAITAGNQYTCALTTEGGVKCWGGNDLGRLGDGTTTDRTTPVDVAGLSTGVAAITAGYWHVCALTTEGGVKCWGGWNEPGTLGSGSTFERHSPVDVAGLSSGVTSIAAGETHTCAITAAGGVKCWGVNTYGQLGNGMTADSYTPVDVVGLSSGVVAIALGSSHTCALTTSGGIKCWGFNIDGRVGDGTSINRDTPTDVSGLATGMVALSAGVSHACALSANGGIKCWGSNFAGQLGDNSTTDRHVPTSVSGLSSGVTSILAGYFYTCAMMGTGGVKCWGSNNAGQLGDNTTTDRHTPINVPSLTGGIASLEGGDWHICALTNAGSVKCWGFNLKGQLGDGTTTERHTPVEVVGFAGGQAVITTYPLTASTSGSGTVSSNPSGIYCTSTCSSNFNSGTSVTLTAAPASGNSFTGWSGACSGTGSCVISMSSAQSVTANFAVNVVRPPTLNGISLSQSSIAIGSTATILPNPSDAGLGTCLSTNSAVASVSGNAVTAQALGVTTIQCGAVTTAVIVTAPLLTGITLASTALTTGSSTNISPLPSQAALGGCASSNTAVATISGAQIQAVGAGNTIISCGNASAALTVTASTTTLTDLTLSCPVTVTGGQADACTARAIYNNDTTRLVQVQWISDNTALSIDSRGSFATSNVSSSTLVNLTATYTEGQVTRTKNAGVQVLASALGACTGNKPYTMLLTLNGKPAAPIVVRTGDPVEIGLCMANFDGLTLLDVYVAVAVAGQNGAPPSFFFASQSAGLFASILWYPWDQTSDPVKFVAKQAIRNLNTLQIVKLNIPPNLAPGVTTFAVQAVFAGKRLMDNSAWSPAWNLGIASFDYQP